MLMLLLRSLSFTVPQYGFFMLFLLAVGFVIYFQVKKRNEKAGRIVLVILITGFLYGAMCEAPQFNFFGMVQNRVKTKENLIALTFDDGPSAKYTPRILDILKENGMRATFFVTGEMAEKHPGIIRRILREGHELGNHTYSHPFMFRDLSALRKEEIQKTDEAVFKITGRHMKYFRAPYEYRDVRLVKLLRRMNYSYISHNESSLDAMGANSKRIEFQIMRQLRPGLIILMHDARGDREPTVEALRNVLPMLREKGYRSVTIGELIAAKTVKAKKKR
ncbi:MAG: polysaccharide deacetylase family protein [bacterium]